MNINHNIMVEKETIKKVNAYEKQLRSKYIKVMYVL